MGASASDNLPGVALDSVLRTEELDRRPSRPPDYAAENRALKSLAQALADHPRTILQTLADTALDVFRAGSAGISLVSTETGDFYWPAIAGAWRPHVGGGTPRNFGPCGVVLDRNAVQLFARPELFYPYLAPASPVIEEVLLAPFYVRGAAVGTVWVVSHVAGRRFDAEDQRVLVSLSTFASAAYQALESLDELERRRAESDGSAERLRKSQNDLAAELEATRRLQRVSLQMAGTGDGELLYADIMDAAVTIMGSDFASMQMLYPQRGNGGELRLLAYRGFNPQAARFWEWVRADSASTCGMALRTGQRSIAPDVENCAFMDGSEDRAVYLQTGIHAVQTTPLVSRGGAMLGMISTHWKKAHNPSDRDLRLLDVLARQAADWIERLQAEEALRQSREQIKLARDLAEATLRTSPVPLLVLQDDLSVITANEAFYQRFNVPPEQAEGRLIYELGNRQWDIPRLRELLEDILPSHTALEGFEVSHEFETMGLRTLLLNARRMEVERGAPERIVLVIEDITDRKQAETALDLAREAAENANRAKDRFLAVLSHELRTPLTPVLMSVVAMDMNPDLAPAVRDDIAMIRRNVELEARLIDDLLDLSRVTAGKLRLNMDAVDVSSAVRHACETCRPLILEKGLRLHCDLPDEPAFVKADAARLQQILWNLLKNAAKFTPEGGDIHVAVSTIRGQCARIEVRDRGIGIAPEVLPRIFNAFEQGDTHITKQFGGMGLGLAISRALAEVHGGSIRAHSEGQARGSTFTVELPLLSREQVPSPAITPGKSDGGQLRVLVVEDHRDTAEVLRRLLQASGHHVKTAYSAAAALELAGKETFDVLVSDIGLPDATGYELMSQIKARYAIKGIAMSGYGMDEDLRKSREAGFDDHIVKPANVAQLERSIRRVAAGGE